MPTISILRDAEAVREAAAQSTSIRGALETLGLRAAGGNYRAFHQACERFGIEAPAWVNVPPPGRPFGAVPDEEVFCENSRFLNRGAMKDRLKRRGVPRSARCAGSEPNGMAFRWYFTLTTSTAYTTTTGSSI